MDMKEDNIEARVLKYFALFNKIFAQHGLQFVLGKLQNQTQQEHARSKDRTKSLVGSLSPNMLKKEIKRMIHVDSVGSRSDERGPVYNRDAACTRATPLLSSFD